MKRHLTLVAILAAALAAMTVGRAEAAPLVYRNAPINDYEFNLVMRTLERVEALGIYDVRRVEFVELNKLANRQPGGMIYESSHNAAAEAMIDYAGVNGGIRFGVYNGHLAYPEPPPFEVWIAQPPAPPGTVPTPCSAAAIAKHGLPPTPAFYADLTACWLIELVVDMTLHEACHVIRKTLVEAVANECRDDLKRRIQ